MAADCFERCTYPERPCLFVTRLQIQNGACGDARPFLVLLGSSLMVQLIGRPWGERWIVGVNHLIQTWTIIAGAHVRAFEVKRGRKKNGNDASRLMAAIITPRLFSSRAKGHLAKIIVRAVPKATARPFFTTSNPKFCKTETPLASQPGWNLGAATST